MPRLRKEDWQTIRKRWEAGESNSSLARAFGVSRAAIVEQADRGRWGAGQAESPGNPAVVALDANVHSDEGRAGLIDLIGSHRAAMVRKRLHAMRVIHRTERAEANEEVGRMRRAIVAMALEIYGGGS